MPHETRHCCRSSYRPFDETTDDLRRLDDHLSAVERAVARRGRADDRRWRLRVAGDRTLLIEGGVPFTTLYLTTAELPATDAHPLRPTVDLDTFWRLWRPPIALVAPRERDWLARRDLADDPAPPLPARYDDEHGWRDYPPDRLDDLIRALRRATQIVSERPRAA